MLLESRYRLAAVVCLVLLLGFVGNAVSSFLVSRHQVRETIEDSSLPLTSDNIYSVVQRDLLQPILISSAMANNTFLRDWILSGEQDVTQIQRYLQEIRRAFNPVASFLVSEATRNYYHVGGILKVVDIENPLDAWYFRVREMEDAFEINFDPDAANEGTLTLFINYRILDYNGQFIGATGAGLSVGHVVALMAEYESRFGRNIVFTDRSGSIVLSADHSPLSGYKNIRNIPGLADHAQAVLNEGTQSLTYEKDGQIYFLHSRFIPELDWFLIVEECETQHMAPLRGQLKLTLLIALVLTLIVAAICITTIQRHQKRLHARNEELLRVNRECDRQHRELERRTAALTTANESLSALNHEKDDLLGLVAHDLRNPLNGILGFSGLILNKLPPKDPTVREFIEIIHTAGHEMLELIAEILSLSAVENTHGSFEIDSVPWNELVRRAVDRYREQAVRKQITVRVDLDERAENSVETRQKWMEICLNNLISNAIKFSQPQSCVTIETFWDLDTSNVEVRIRDQGPGIDDQEIRGLFKKFGRGSARPTAGESSTGLGLYIVRKMCDRLGARVSVESALGAGSTFVIRHPARQSPQPTFDSNP